MLERAFANLVVLLVDYYKVTLVLFLLFPLIICLIFWSLFPLLFYVGYAVVLIIFLVTISTMSTH